MDVGDFYICGDYLVMTAGLYLSGIRVELFIEARRTGRGTVLAR